MDSNQKPSTVFTVPVPKQEPPRNLILIFLNLAAGMIIAYWLTRLFGSL